MKNLIYLIMISAFVFACGTTRERDMASNTQASDTVRIANDSLEFELVVFEPGFERWLAMQSPKESFSLDYLESKNRRYTTQYNMRARNPSVYGNLYPHPINYEFEVDYGLELNYMLYHYFEFFQKKYNQRL